MRAFGALLAGALVWVTALPASASSLAITVPDTVSQAQTDLLTVTGSGTFDAPGLAQVFTDGTLDDQLFLEATAPVQDLVAGFMEVDRGNQSLNFTWQVLALPDVPGGVPELFRYMWDFAVTPAGGQPSLFQVNAKFTNFADGSGGPMTDVPAGEVNGSCVTGPVITCARIGSAPVTFDPATDRITMRVPWSLLTNGLGQSVVGEGATFATTPIFQGITAIVQVVLSPGQAGDVATDSPFMIGEHVQLTLVPPGLTDEELELEAMDLVAAAGDGSFSADLDISTFPVGTYEVVARPCTDAGCGAFVRDSVTITA